MFRCVVFKLLCGGGYVLHVVGCFVVLCINCCVVVVISCLLIDGSSRCVPVVVWWWIPVACCLRFRCVVFGLLCGGYFLRVDRCVVVLWIGYCVVVVISCLLLDVPLCCVLVVVWWWLYVDCGWMSRCVVAGSLCGGGYLLLVV